MNRILFIFSLTISLVYSVEYRKTSLEDAIQMVKNKNIELKNLDLDIEISDKDISIAKGKHLGKVDIEHQFINSNAPENVFGFKLSNGEATFNDFGFDEFLGQMPGLPGNAQELLATAPDNLNNPEARNFSKTTIKYEIPLYAGGMISNYGKIAEKIKDLRKLQKNELLDEKIFELKKSFYSFKLLSETKNNLTKIYNNISRLQDTVIEMNKAGYAKKVDILEVKARLTHLKSFLNDIESNKKLLLNYVSFLTQTNITDLTIPKNISKVTEFYVEDTNQVQMAETAMKINKDLLNVGYASYLPKIGGFAEMRVSNDALIPSYDNDKYTIGIVLQMNIFNGMADKLDIEKKKLNLLKSQNNYKLAKQGIELKLRQLKTELKTLSLNETAQISNVELFNEIEKNYQHRYKEKLVSINDVLIKNSILLENVMKLKKIQTHKQLKILEIQKLSEEN